jgi:hypothetical protein
MPDHQLLPSEFGYNGLFDQRRRKRTYLRVPMETAERMLALSQETYFDLSVRHFHEKLREEHGIELSYTWVKQALQPPFLKADIYRPNCAGHLPC